MLIILSQSHRSPGRRDSVSLLSRPCGPRVREWQFSEQGVDSVAGRKESRYRAGKPHKGLPRFCHEEIGLLVVPIHEATGHESLSPLPPERHLYPHLQPAPLWVPFFYTTWP